jgi:hypothetical protein
MSAPLAEVQMSGQKQSIGVAWKEADGTIIVRLRAESEGCTGDLNMRFAKAHPKYAQVLAYLGGLSDDPEDAVVIYQWDFNIAG